MVSEMTTQAQAPTEEMRIAAYRWLTGDSGLRCYLPSVVEHLAQEFALIAAAQDRLAVERCAKWHDEQADNWLL